jgi:hypothetical protein
MAQWVIVVTDGHRHRAEPVVQLTNRAAPLYTGSMTRLPSLAYFIPAWVLGALGVLLAGAALVFFLLLVPAGVLLLLAARQVAADPEDPWYQMNRRLPRVATSGLDPKGKPVQLLTALVLGVLGVALIVGGLLGPFGVWTN